MKKFDVYKTIQLILFILLAVIGLALILTDSDLYQQIASNPGTRALGVLLWLAFAAAFLFIFMDFSLFSAFKKDFRELDYAASSDPVSGIANRYSCDALIEKYLDQPLPANLGCVMFDLANIHEINRAMGHVNGNELILEFSGILQNAAMGVCFVGRNGGNRFLALFEDCSEEQIQTFLTHVAEKVDAYNASSDAQPILYRYGIAFHEESASVSTITDLIALSVRRIYSVSP